MTLPIGEAFERLMPRVRELSGMLYDDHELTSAAVTARMGGVEHEVRLVRQGDGDRLTIRGGAAVLYRGKLAAFYGTAERARRAA